MNNLNLIEQAEKEDMAWDKIYDHFEGQKPDRDELTIFVNEIFEINVDEDDGFIDLILGQFDICELV